MKKKMKFYCVFLIVAMMVMMFSIQTVTATKEATPVIKIGGLGPLSILPGQDMKRAMELAISDVNSNGGVTVAGTNYNLEGDYQTTSGADGLPDSTVAGTSLTTLKGDGVVAVIGGFRTEVAISLQSQLQQLPFLGVGSTAPIITPYFWRVGPTNGTNLATCLLSFFQFYMYKGLGVKNITIVREQADWSLAISNAIKYVFATAFASDNVTFSADIPISTSASQDSVTASLKTVPSNTNAILELFSAPVGQYVTQAWAALNMTQFLAGINVQAQLSTYFQDTAGAAYGEIELETTNPSTTRPQAVAFRNEFYSKYSLEPTYTAYASYDAVNILVQALEKSSSPTSAQIQSNLDSTNYNGTAFTTRFTNEIGPQYGVNSSGMTAPVPGVNYTQKITVHDLYTPENITMGGGIYPNPVMVQWQKGGVKKEIYSNLPDFLSVKLDGLQWPINHSDNGYTTSAKSSPGFEFFAVFVTLGTVIAYKKYKKV